MACVSKRSTGARAAKRASCEPPRQFPTLPGPTPAASDLKCRPEECEPGLAVFSGNFSAFSANGIYDREQIEQTEYGLPLLPRLPLRSPIRLQTLRHSPPSLSRHRSLLASPLRRHLLGGPSPWWPAPARSRTLQHGNRPIQPIPLRNQQLQNISHNVPSLSAQRCNPQPPSKNPARTMRRNRNGSRTCCMERRLAQQRPNGESLAWTITLNSRTRASIWTLRRPLSVPRKQTVSTTQERTVLARACYFRVVILGNFKGSMGLNNPNENTAVADAIATYCSPSTS